MISKAELKNFIERIKTKTGLSQEEISVAAGYAAKSLTQLISKGDTLDDIHEQLNRVFGHRLKNSTYGEKELVGELLDSLKERIQEQKEMNEKLSTIIQVNLTSILTDTKVSLAYQKAWVEFVAEKDSRGNPAKKEAIILKMGKLIRGKLGINQKKDILSDGI